MTCPVPGKLLTLALFVLTLATPAWSQEPEQEQSGFAKEGGYMGGAVMLDAKLNSDTFDGASIYKKINGEEYLILPLFEKATMFRGILGVRYPKAAFEFSYDRTPYQGTFLGGTGEATLQAINVDGRYFFATNGRVQPHLLGGGSFPWLTVKDGSALNANVDADVGDATYRGLGVNAEAGVTIYPHPQLGIGVGYRYRVMWFDRAKGVSKTEYELRPRFRENSGSLVINGLFTF
jgi:opacity protein-like surface antigen